MLPEFSVFLSGENLTFFWQVLKWFLFFVSSIVMIDIALSLASRFVSMLRNLFDGTTKKSRRNREEEDY